MSFLGANAASYAGLGFISSGIKSIGQIIGGSQQKKAYDQNAGIYEDQAEAHRLKQSIDEYKARKAANKTVGEQQAAYVAAGVNPMTGSPLDVMVDSLNNSFFDMEINKYNNALLAARYENESKMTKYVGEEVKREGVFNAGLSLLEGGLSYGREYGGV